MKAGSEIVISEGIIAAEIEELWLWLDRVVLVIGCVEEIQIHTLVDVNHLSA